LKKGQFKEAVEAFRRGHELGIRTSNWTHPSRLWLRQAEHLARLDDRLGAVLAGQDRPKDTAERLGFAQLCQRQRQRYAAAARFYQEAFAAQATLAADLQAGHRYNAACAAALAGCGLGKDGARLDPEERTRLRQQALTWLEADLKAYRQLLEKAADRAGLTIVQRMQHWLADDAFAGVRGAGPLARLPEAQRQDWQNLWKEVEALRQRAAARPKATSSARP
jgi:serine/threonine-protein kinase